MKKFWLVFRYEYLHHVMRRRFLFALLSIPFFVAFSAGLGFLSVEISSDRSPIGYVDNSGFLAHPVPPPSSDNPYRRRIEILAFPDEAAARTALDAKRIQAYYVLAPDYLQTGHVRLVSFKDPDESAQATFAAFLRANLTAGQPADIVHRLNEGTSLEIVSLDGMRSMAQDEWYNIALPILTGILFMIAVMTSGGYLLQAVVEEKENRTMEIIVTSLSPGQLMAGKIAGNLSVGLTQLLVWVLFIAAGVFVSQTSFGWLPNLHLSPYFVALTIAILLPSFILIAALMAAIGATVTESREAQQISGLFTLPVFVPLWLIYPMMIHPNGPLAVGLSFFPLTAPVALTLRAAFTQIPALQLAANLILLLLCAGGAVALSARVFRLGMLRYGKRLSLREIFSRAG